MNWMRRARARFDLRTGDTMSPLPLPESGRDDEQVPWCMIALAALAALAVLGAICTLIALVVSLLV